MRVLRNQAKQDEATARECVEPCLAVLRKVSESDLHHHAAYVLRNCMHHHRAIAQRIRERGGVGLLLALLSRTFNSPYAPPNHTYAPQYTQETKNIQGY